MSIHSAMFEASMGLRHSADGAGCGTRRGVRPGRTVAAAPGTLPPGELLTQVGRQIDPMRVQGIELEAEASTLKALEAGLWLVGGDVLPNDK